jgi:hypothetical protein
MQDHNYILLNTELLSKFTASFTRRAYKQVSELPNINSMADLHFDKQEINNCFFPCLFKKPKAHYNVQKTFFWFRAWATWTQVRFQMLTAVSTKMTPVGCCAM